jgi:hypothetical protein
LKKAADPKQKAVIIRRLRRALQGEATAGRSKDGKPSFDEG